jgi:two-component system sensor histidine kinase QseC
MANSIRRRLLFSLLLVISMIGSFTVWTSYRESAHEVQELFDAQLAQSARVLLSILLTRTQHEDFKSIQEFLDAGGKMPAVSLDNTDDELDHDFHNYERKISFQLWDKDGRLLLHSASVGSEPLSPAGLKPNGKGYRDEIKTDGTWRIFSLWDVKQEYLIQVGERYDIRGELVTEIVYHFIMPSVLSLPLLAVLIWWSIGRAMKPLYRIRDAIAHRDPRNLDYMQLENAPVEVVPLVQELNNLFSALNRAFEVERRFTDDAAHELRTPLSALKTQVQVALRSDSEADRQEALENIIIGVDRMTHLLNQMLTLARLDNARDLQLMNVDLEDTISAITRQLAEKTRQKNISVKYQPTQKITFLSEPVSLEMLLRNLIDNAVNYTPAGGEVVIETLENPDEVLINITDTGPGINPEMYERVFERYFRKPGQVQNGSGLGLSIARRCADLLGAKLDLQKPAAGNGLMVQIVLPREKQLENSRMRIS